MTEKEARSFFLDEVFVAFPAVKLWIKESSKDPDKTLGYWCKPLAGVELEEAMEVLQIWVSGKDPNNKPPEAYQRDVFALHLRACVLDMRAKHAAQVRFAEPTTVPSGERYSPQTDELYVKHWVPMKNAVDAKEISEESARRQWHAIIDYDPVRDRAK